jgi:hypothetical protein
VNLLSLVEFLFLFLPLSDLQLNCQSTMGTLERPMVNGVICFNRRYITRQRWGATIGNHCSVHERKRLWGQRNIRTSPQLKIVRFQCVLKTVKLQAAMFVITARMDPAPASVRPVLGSTALRVCLAHLGALLRRDVDRRLGAAVRSLECTRCRPLPRN